MVLDIGEVRFVELDPSQLSRETFGEIQLLHRSAFEASNPGRRQSEYDYFAQMNDPEGFRQGRIDPTYDMERGRLRKDQLFKRPSVILAYLKQHLVGELYSVDNTSGHTDFERDLKMKVPPVLSIPKFGHRRYLYGREIVVDPEQQHRAIGHALGYLAVTSPLRNPRQPMAVYSWDDQVVTHLTNNLKFEVTDTDPDHQPFGVDTAPVNLRRLAAPALKAVAQAIIDQPRLSELTMIAAAR